MTHDVDATLVQRLIDRARPVSDCLGAAGFKSYVVGGLVRDLHLGRSSSPDVDITTDATPDVMKRVFAKIADELWAQGERFGTIGLKVKGTEFEVTTHRSENYESTSRKPTVQFSTAIDADLSRRDFTINAMAIEASTGRLVDPFDGAYDLAHRVLRTPGAPEDSFNDDPLRMLRAARFHAGYGLQPVAELEAAMRTLAPRIEIVSNERVRDETKKLLGVERPGAGVRLLGRTGLLALIVDGYDEATSDDVAEVVDVVTRAEEVRRGAFYLLFAERNGVAALQAHLAARKHSTREQQSTTRILAAALSASESDFGSDDRSVREFLAAAGELTDAATEIVALERLAGAAAAERFESRMVELAKTESLQNLGPALSGTQVMTLLGLETGPDVGHAIDFLRTLRLTAGELAQSEVETRLRDWHEGRGLTHN
jgi:poly(A) polymerase